MILVTGATGKVGGQVVAQLLDAGVAVRALTRDPASATLPEGAEVVRGDLADPATLDDALDGVESVFLVWPTFSADHAAPAAVETIAKHARGIVYLSARGVPDPTPGAPEQDPNSILGSHALMERLIERSGLEWTFLRPGGFAANTLMWASQIRDTGTVRWLHGAASRALIHERDIAAAGVSVLTGTGHAGARYVLSGPETLTQIEQVTAIGEAIGRPIRWEELPPEIALRGLLDQGWSPAAAEELTGAYARMVAYPESTTSAVEELTGRPATPFRQWAADHADDFR
ncbi:MULTISPECIES: NAD(P)H-binding protein [unclassified Streptosporangium]|uniref:NAD(P)H-binding protein n=1 Tax=unclassified Streptosporangium TaxID=2632669 RepID=UPI002E2B4DD8|nr:MULTISPECIES: NAD(P)H-binding protein [unclassified Streptosporangium]